MPTCLNEVKIQINTRNELIQDINELHLKVTELQKVFRSLNTSVVKNKDQQKSLNESRETLTRAVISADQQRAQLIYKLSEISLPNTVFITIIGTLEDIEARLNFPRKKLIADSHSWCLTDNLLNRIVENNVDIEKKITNNDSELKSQLNTCCLNLKFMSDEISHALNINGEKNLHRIYSSSKEYISMESNLHEETMSKLDSVWMKIYPHLTTAACVPKSKIAFNKDEKIGIITISHVENSVIMISSEAAAAQILDCNNITLVLEEITSSVMIRRCSKIRVWCKSKQLRLANVTDSVFYVNCNSEPILESSSNLLFGTYGTCPIRVALVDFNWQRCSVSPNWRILQSDCGISEFSFESLNPGPYEEFKKTLEHFSTYEVNQSKYDDEEDDEL